MMSSSTPTARSAVTNARVLAHPRFQELVRRRTRLASALTAAVLIGYYSYMAIVAFAPGLLHQPLGSGTSITIGWPIGAVLIVGSWLLTGWYVWRANGQFDRINRQIVDEVQS